MAEHIKGADKYYFVCHKSAFCYGQEQSNNHGPIKYNPQCMNCKWSTLELLTQLTPKEIPILKNNIIEENRFADLDLSEEVV